MSLRTATKFLRHHLILARQPNLKKSHLVLLTHAFGKSSCVRGHSVVTGMLPVVFQPSSVTCISWPAAAAGGSNRTFRASPGSNEK